MIFYHFTEAVALFGIGVHGLTVGDVPTDLRKGRGLVGVWLTTSPTAQGHGLDKSARHKLRYRLSVDLEPGTVVLHRWEEWAARNVTPETINGLHSTAPEWRTWWIFFGVIKPDRIVECYDVDQQVEVPDWRSVKTPESKGRSVPPWRREAWQRKMLKQVSRALTAPRR